MNRVSLIVGLDYNARRERHLGDLLELEDQHWHELLYRCGGRKNNGEIGFLIPGGIDSNIIASFHCHGPIVDDVEGDGHLVDIPNVS